MQRDGAGAQEWSKVDLKEVLKLMEDLIEYFAQPAESDGFLSSLPFINFVWSIATLFKCKM